MHKFFYQLKAFIFVAVTNAYLVAANAGQIKIDDFKNSTGAGNKDVTALTDKGGKVMQNFLDLLFMGFTFAGVVVTGMSIYKLYQASQDDSREKPKSAIVGIVVGPVLISLGLVIGYLANTFNV